MSHVDNFLLTGNCFALIYSDIINVYNIWSKDLLLSLSFFLNTLASCGDKAVSHQQQAIHVCSHIKEEYPQSW